jgi:hypothetical protein
MNRSREIRSSLLLKFRAKEEVASLISLEASLNHGFLMSTNLGLAQGMARSSRQ